MTGPVFTSGLTMDEFQALARKEQERREAFAAARAEFRAAKAAKDAPGMQRAMDAMRALRRRAR